MSPTAMPFVPRTAFVAGATGFVGRHLIPVLQSAAVEVIGGSRNPEDARKHAPDIEWRTIDLENAESLDGAFRGVDVAFDLVHQMGEGAGDYPEKEREGAGAFRRAAERSGVQRLVYLGGVLPKDGEPSKHLKSRAATGKTLRSGEIEAIELRAAMILGEGSASWTMCHDLAKRLPAMVLPSWTQNHSWPIGIEDVARALVEAAFLPRGESRIYDVPGAERVTHEEMLRRVAAAMQRDFPALRVPLLTPRLSSYWVALVTGVDLSMAQELVEGIKHDLDPTQPVLWDVIDTDPQPLDEAIEAALRDGAQASNHALRPGRQARLREVAKSIRRRIEARS